MNVARPDVETADQPAEVLEHLRVAVLRNVDRLVGIALLEADAEEIVVEAEEEEADRAGARATLEVDAAADLGEPALRLAIDASDANHRARRSGVDTEQERADGADSEA